MKLTKEVWTAAIKKASTDLASANQARGASDGIVCAVASLRVLRDVYGVPKDTIKSILADIQGASLMGFLSNASSAAATAGLKAGGEALPITKLAD